MHPEPLINELMVGPEITVPREDSDINYETDASGQIAEASTEVDQVDSLESIFTTLLREITELKSLLAPYTKKRSLLVFTGHSDMLKLREAASASVSILKSLLEFVQVASAFPLLEEKFIESEVHSFRLLLLDIRKYVFVSLLHRTKLRGTFL